MGASRPVCALIALLGFGNPAAAGAAEQCNDAAVEATAQRIGTAAYLMLIDGVPVAAYGDDARAYRIHSMRKSILSALIGIAAARGDLSLDQTLSDIGISDYAPLSEQESRATLSDLLASRSGIYRPATYENEAFDRVRPARGSAAPGERWFYSNWDFNTAGTIFQIRTSRSICGGMIADLARPLGMQDFNADNCRWRYSARSRQPAYVFRMSARDLARFGELMRRRGAYRGRQLVPADWIDRSTAPLSDVAKPDGTPMPGVAYGLMWWTARDGTAHFPDLDDPPDLGDGAFAAVGTGTQMLIVAPALGMIFVHLADTDDETSPAVDQADVGRLLRALIRLCAPGE